MLEGWGEAGVKQDYARAMLWYRKAADQGHCKYACWHRACSYPLLRFQSHARSPWRRSAAQTVADWPVQQVASVEISAGTYYRSFHRDPGGLWLPEAVDTASAADLSEQIEAGLKLLHNSAPQRTDLTRRAAR
jgi:hypothetical protein